MNAVYPGESASVREILELAEHLNSDATDADLGAEAARLIWDDADDAGKIHDPRTPAFARAMIDTSVAILRSSKGLIKKMIDRAAAGAEDLAVAQFQGIVEVIQNADDVRATEIKLALRERNGRKELLIVHNGEAVTCHHVLGMALPYLTTKTERVDQRGRFGIGLKTLKRIADSIAIHSAPYHFSGDQLRFDWVEPELALADFYDPAVDTLLVLGLTDEFLEEDLRSWFDAWQDDGLIFLTTVSRFRWCAIDGRTIAEKTLFFSDWEDVFLDEKHEGLIRLRSRRINGTADSWTVWRATVKVPTKLHPAHKARSETTDISVALADGDSKPALYIGFKSQVPIDLQFSLDAQFDPNTSREAIIENAWNSWLVERTAEIAEDIAAGILIRLPALGWRLVPLESEGVGKKDDPWVRARFAASLEAAREWLRQHGKLLLNGVPTPLAELSYEDETLAGFLSPGDVETIATQTRAVGDTVRDHAGRWRSVLDTLAVSTVVDTDDLLDALEQGTFADKKAEWWVAAAARLVEHHPDDQLFGRAFLLSEEYGSVSCHPAGETDRPLVFDAAPSAFAARWKLLDRLHPSFGTKKAGKQVIGWLTANAAFTGHLDAATELAAFAERFVGTHIEISDDELRDLRERFDGVSDFRAEQLGKAVGSVLVLDGHAYKGGKVVREKVRLAESYLCKTLDGENSTWPDAAGTAPGILWITARYESVLKTDAGRWVKRKREDGRVSRGPRRFLTLLGAEVAPRLSRTDEHVRWGSDTRVAELRQRGADQVRYDVLSPDLSRVLKSFGKLPKRDTKLRSPALLRTLSRHWERLYADHLAVPAEHKAIKHTHYRGEVTAAWLNELCETPWIAIGRGELEYANRAVLKTPETQTLYDTFVCDISPDEVHEELAAALHLITDVRIGDLITRLEELRDNGFPVVEAYVYSIYRTIAKRCPRTVAYNTAIGELTAQELRRHFLAGDGLVYVGSGQWRRPDQVLRGPDIFHGMMQFVPSGTAFANLWMVLDVAEPDMDDCVRFCRNLAQSSYDLAGESALLDVYRFMEKLVGSAERKHREKLKVLPLVCSGAWVTARPIYYVENVELREQLAASAIGLKCWSPPCDIRDFPQLASLFIVETLEPKLTVVGGQEDAAERGEQFHLRFCHAVDHLSTELARNDPVTRDRIAIGWDQLKNVPLFVYDAEISVRAESAILPRDIGVSLRALVQREPQAFHLRDEDIGDRDFGGRVIATLFPPEVRRRIDVEWEHAWRKSRDAAAQAIRLASDGNRNTAMQEAADAINAAPKVKIKVTAPASRDSTLKPRTLKAAVGAVIGATVKEGTSGQKPPTTPGSGNGLKTKPPQPSKPDSNETTSAPTAYTNLDLEQRGWEILVQALETSPDHRLVDFRTRQGVGSDGAFNWERFVEMKATGRGPQSQIELSNTEYERAKQRGSDFILALVSGLEMGQKDEVRLIFDPANCTTVKPTNGVRMGGLLDAPAVIVHFEDISKEI